MTSPNDNLSTPPPTAGPTGDAFAAGSYGTATEERSGDTGGQTKEKASGLRDQAREQYDETKNRLKDDARRVADQGRQMGREAMERSQQAIDERKHMLADEIGTFGKAIRRAGEQLHQDNDEAVARYADMAADQIDRFSESLRDTSLNDLADGAQRFARRHPEVVLGGMFIAGLAVARFLKARPPQHDYDGGEPDFDNAYRGDLDYEMSGTNAIGYNEPEFRGRSPYDDTSRFEGRNLPVDRESRYTEGGTETAPTLDTPTPTPTTPPTGLASGSAALPDATATPPTTTPDPASPFAVPPSVDTSNESNVSPITPASPDAAVENDQNKEVRP